MAGTNCKQAPDLIDACLLRAEDFRWTNCFTQIGRRCPVIDDRMPEKPRWCITGDPGPHLDKIR